AAGPAGSRPVVAGSAEELRDRLHGADLDLLIDTVAGPGLSACVGAMQGGGRIVLVGYAGGVRVEFDATELLVRDVSLLPLNGIGRESDTVPHTGEWLDAIVRGHLHLATAVLPVQRLADDLAVGRRAPPP